MVLSGHGSVLTFGAQREKKKKEKEVEALSDQGRGTCQPMLIHGRVKKRLINRREKLRQEQTAMSSISDIVPDVNLQRTGKNGQHSRWCRGLPAHPRLLIRRRKKTPRGWCNETPSETEVFVSYEQQSLWRARWLLFWFFCSLMMPTCHWAMALIMSRPQRPGRRRDVPRPSCATRHADRPIGPDCCPND